MQMINFGLFLGIYSYVIFLLGILGNLNEKTIVAITFICLLIFFHYFKTWRFDFTLILKRKEIRLFIILIVLQAAVNLIGSLGPELAFDALWYHLTLPKIYLLEKTILYIPGGLFYYSAMPKLIEMLYISAIAVHSEIFAKVIHFFFGLLCLFALFRLSRLFVSVKYAVVACSIFYANLVVAWESTTAYIDLARTFFEILALYCFVLYVRKGEVALIFLCAIFIGLAITTKLLAFGTFLILLSLLVYHLFVQKTLRSVFISRMLLFVATSLFIGLPWYLFSFMHTANPLFPFFTPESPVKINIIKFLSADQLISSLKNFVSSPDPISPVYLAILPLLLFKQARSFKKEEMNILFFALLGIIVWHFTPKTSGGRFILPYLPVLSLIVTIVLQKLMTSQFGRNIHRSIIIFIILISIISIVYRLGANLKYLPVILGLQTRQEFLASNLNFSFGDFYDVDGYFSRELRDDIILLYGFHNLYYFPVSFIDQSWVKKGDHFTLIATQQTYPPRRFASWHKVYENKLTGVSLYKGETRHERY